MRSYLIIFLGKKIKTGRQSTGLTQTLSDIPVTLRVFIFLDLIEACFTYAITFGMLVGKIPEKKQT